VVGESLPGVRPEWSTATIDACQVMIGFFTHADSRQFKSAVDRLVSQLADSRTPVERALAAQLILSVSARVALSEHSVDSSAMLNARILAELTGNTTNFLIALNEFRSWLATKNCSCGLAGVNGSRVAAALAIIRAEFTLKLSGDAVAMRLRMSESQLNRILRAHTGRTFWSNLHFTRVNAAADLLLTTSLSVKEIAAAVGYEGTRQLDRHFHKYRGITPSTFRTRDDV